MKKLKLFFACLLMAVLSIGQVWGAEELKATIDFSSNDFGISTTKILTENTYTHDGISLTLVGTTGGGYQYNSSHYLILGKQNATLTFSAFSWSTTKIVVTGRSGASGSVKQNIFVGETAVSTETTGATGTNTYAIASTAQAAGTIYTLKVTSAHNTQITKIEIYGEGSGSTKTLSSIEVSGDPDKTSYYAGDNFDPTGLTVTGTYSDQSQSAITSGITWSYNPAQELALNQTSIGVIATVDNIASAEFTVSSLSVTEAPAAVNYELVTDASVLAEGDEIIIANEDADKAISTTQNSNNRAATNVSESNDVIAVAPGSDVQVLTLGITNEHWTLYTGEGYLYASSNSSNQMKTQATNNANGEWTISISAGVATLIAQGTNSRNEMRYNPNGGNPIFCCYASTSTMGKVKIYKKVDGTVKPAAGLAYNAEDQKKLAKLGVAFTAPTLDNPNNLTGITYASNNTDVAEVASNGAVTIKAAGVAVITASFAGNDDYKAGDASYTIAVTNHAGTAADPFVAADAKIVIDAFETFENVHVSGIVSQVLTSTLPAEGYISFNISDNGALAGQQTQAYKCKSFNGEAFTAITDVETGATVIVAGNLKKYQSTYEFDQNCYLVSYTAPAAQKQSIANTKETAYSVAQALVYAADGVTYDLDDYVYIQGVVFKVESFNSTNGTLNIFIKDANAENQFEFFKCAGINDGESTTPFEALTDVQEGDEVIGYGQMMYYQQSSIYEFKQGNYLVELNRPEVAVESVELASSATVKVDKTINLSASVLPANATDKEIVWSIVSGDANITLDNGAVTGVEEGTAVVRATSHADNTKYAECTITIAAADPTYLYYNYEKVTATSGIEDGEYLIVYEGEDGALAFNGGLETLDAVENTIAVTIEDNRIESNATTDAAAFTIDVTNGTLLAASGKYIGVTTYSNGLTSSDEPIAHSSISIAEESANIVVTTTGGDMTLRYNKASNQLRFRYYKSGQEAIQLYKKVGTNEPPKANPQLAWDPADDIELTVGDAFTAPSLTYAQGFDGADDVVIASDNESVAIINNSGEVELVADATGEATITATFAGNDNYKAASASFKITVNAAPVVITDYFEKVTSGDVAEGTYLIVYEEGSLAFNGGLETLDAKNNVIDVEITNDNKIGVTTATEAATFYIEPAAGTIQAVNGKYIGVTSNSNGLKQSDNADAYENAFAIDADGNAVISAVFENANMTMRYNKASDQNRFRYFGSGQQPIALYKLANEVIKPEAGLAWDPAEDITLIVGDAFTAPTLLNPNNIDAAEITIESSNTDVATINAGVVELVENATGTTTITATFAGNASYKPATVSYKIKVNPANSIYVSTLNVNFGSVAKDATVEDKVITVTLTGVPAASVALAGNGASAFTFTPDALTASGDITISASSATAGTFNATLTISDDAGVAASKEVSLKLIVSDPTAEETPISTSTEWVVATAADLVDGAEVIITGVKDEVVYAMGEQKNTNRAAYAATVDGEGVLTPGEGTMAFTLVAQDGGTYALRTSDGKYLYAAGDGANHLKTQAEVDVNAKWTLAVNSAVAEGSTNRNIMRFNGSGTNNLFSCYSTGQTEIKFYVPKPVTPPTPAYVDVRTGLEPNHYYTICYPNAMSSIKGATLWSFIGKDAQYAYLVQETATTIEAGKPYIMYATASTVQAVLGDETNAPGANGAIHGTFSNLVQEQLDNLATVAGNDLYLVIGDELRRVTGYDLDGITPLVNNSLPAQRAFVVVGEIPDAPANMPAHVRRMPMQTDQAQGFENIEASDKPMKLMIDGQMYILRGEKVYDATGRLVK